MKNYFCIYAILLMIVGFAFNDNHSVSQTPTTQDKNVIENNESIKNSLEKSFQDRLSIYSKIHILNGSIWNVR